MAETYTVSALIGQGLTEEESRLLEKYVADGKPGLAKTRAERMSEIFCLGYS